MLLGCIANDTTGASDLANTLAKNDIVTVQFVGVPHGKGAIACEAGVLALKTRSIAPAPAVRQFLEAMRWLHEQGCSQILLEHSKRNAFPDSPRGWARKHVKTADLTPLGAKFTRFQELAMSNCLAHSPGIQAALPNSQSWPCTATAFGRCVIRVEYQQTVSGNKDSMTAAAVRR